VYVGIENVDRLSPIQTVIGDYKYSIIMDSHIESNESTSMECTITRFTRTLNTIETIINEIWKPREDSYTSYLGEQCIAEAGGIYYAFRTLSSDDTFWNVYFNVHTKKPEMVIADGEKPTKILIKRDFYRWRTHFDKSEFMPQECEDSKNIEQVEGPIIPLADFGFLF